MLGRLGFAGRLMAIVLLTILVMQAVATGIGYMSRMRQGPGEALMLLPERAAAIVDLIEPTGKDRRESLLRALSSDTLHVAYSAERPAIDATAQRLPAVEWVVEQYLPEAGRREVMAFITPEQGPRWRQLRIGQYWLTSREPLRIAIGLKAAATQCSRAEETSLLRYSASLLVSSSERSARSLASRRSSPSGARRAHCGSLWIRSQASREKDPWPLCVHAVRPRSKS